MPSFSQVRTYERGTPGAKWRGECGTNCGSVRKLKIEPAIQGPNTRVKLLTRVPATDATHSMRSDRHAATGCSHAMRTRPIRQGHATVLRNARKAAAGSILAACKSTNDVAQDSALGLGNSNSTVSSSSAQGQASHSCVDDQRQKAQDPRCGLVLH